MRRSLAARAALVCGLGLANLASAGHQRSDMAQCDVGGCLSGPCDPGAIYEFCTNFCPGWQVGTDFGMCSTGGGGGLCDPSETFYYCYGYET